MADPIAFAPGFSHLARKALAALHRCHRCHLALEAQGGLGALGALGHSLAANFLDIAGQVLHLRVQLRNAPGAAMEAWKSSKIHGSRSTIPRGNSSFDGSSGSAMVD